MTSAIEWVRAMQAEGWVVAYVEVAEAVGAAIVGAGLLTAEQVKPERMSGQIVLTTTNGVTFNAVLSQ